MDRGAGELQSMGSQRVRHSLVTKQKYGNPLAGRDEIRNMKINVWLPLGKYSGRDKLGVWD